MRRLTCRIVVALFNAVDSWLLRHPKLYRLLFLDALSGVRWRLGVWRALVNIERAYRRVPAYRDFVDQHGGLPRSGVRDLAVMPETDKGTYVLRYDHAARCLGGRFPDQGVVIDESSGSSGRPANWVRGPQERAATKAMLQFSFRAALGDETFFVINAFALGAWATGLNVSMGLSDICILKSTGPDIDKIVDTIAEFGPDHSYVVLGYPPFLKSLADDDRIDWSAHRVRAVFGGEAMSEPMRAYLLGSFTEVIGSYGASDLEINMAVETPFTIALRRELQHNAALRRRLTHTTGALPMIFQYNPLVYVFETNAKDELVVTLARPTNIAPKLRYNIHDLGHVARFGDVAQVLADLGESDLIATTKPVRLPLLFLYGRSDQSIDYYGANVTPDSVHEILFQLDELAPHLHGFQLISSEDGQCDKTLEIAVELNDGLGVDHLDAGAIAEQVFTRLARANRDFSNAYRHTATASGLPRLSLHPRGTGPFTDGGNDRIKRQYIATANVSAVG